VVAARRFMCEKNNTDVVILGTTQEFVIRPLSEEGSRRPSLYIFSFNPQ
jgi:hypothetical protein